MKYIVNIDFGIFSTKIMGMSAIDRTKIYKKFKGLWVALLHDEETVVGSGKTLKEALNKARKDGYDSPIMTRMPKNLAPCIGGYYEV